MTGADKDTFEACRLPWRIWPWGVTLIHSDTDFAPECTVEFGALLPMPEPPFKSIWVRAEFLLAAFVSAKPHRDDEDLREVTGYDVIPLNGGGTAGSHEQQTADWLRTGWCPDPGLYYATESGWLRRDRRSWTERQRTDRSPDDAVHFLVNGRDGYVELLAAGFEWTAWSSDGPPKADQEPVSRGRWERAAQG